MSDASGSPDRERLLERAGKLWDSFVKADRTVFDAGFTGWGTPLNTQVWESVAASRGPRLVRLVNDVRPEQLQDAIEAYLTGMDELQALRGEISALDQAGTGSGTLSGPDGVHASALAAELNHRSEERLTGENPGLLVGKYVGKKINITPRVIEVSPEAGASIGVSAQRAQALSALAGTVKKVDRVDEALLELLRERVEKSLRIAGIDPSSKGTELGTVSRAAVVNAALVMVVRASGVTGIRLNEEGELLVELLGDAGDLARTASIDARLALLGDQLDRMEATGRATHKKAALIEKQGFLTQLIATFSLAERLRIVRPGTERPESEVDLAEPKVLSFLRNLEGQARRELVRRTDAEGRPAPQKADESMSL